MLDLRRAPDTFAEAEDYFSSELSCVRWLAHRQWPHGVQCPRCGATRMSFLTNRYVWKCLACSYHFSVRHGTILARSPLPIRTWLLSAWLCAQYPTISSYRLARHVHVSQKTAWRMQQRLRHAPHLSTGELPYVSRDTLTHSHII